LEYEKINRLESIALEINKLSESNLIWGFFSMDLLINTFVTIFIFWLGYLVNSLLKKWQAREQAKSIREAFEYWISAHENIFSSQNDSIDTFVNKLTGSKEIHEERMSVKTIQLKKLDEIPFLHLMNTYVSNSRGDKSSNEKALFNMVSSIGFLTSFSSRVFDKYSDFSVGTDKLREEWNEAFTKFDKTKVSFLLAHSNRQDKLQLEIVSEINSLSNIFLMSKNSPDNPITAGEWHDEYFIPIRTILHIGMSENPSIIELQELAWQVEELVVVYKKWTAWRDGFVEVFKEFKTRNIESFDNLKVQTAHFKEQKLVFLIWFSPFIN